MTDKRVQRLLLTDPDRGVNALIERYGGLVTAVISGKLRSSRFTVQDIEDCAAETFFEFWHGFEKSPCKSEEIRSRLCVIAKRNAIDILRKAYKHPDTVSFDSGEIPEPVSDLSIEGVFDEKEQRLELIRSIKALGLPDSEIIIRKYYIGQSSKQIAADLGYSVSNVDTRTHRAINKLRRKLGGNGNE